MNESHNIQLDNLNAEYRILKARYEHHGQQMRQLIKWIFLSPLLGIALGAFGMIYFELPKPQPVVEIERSAADPSRMQAALVKLTTVNRAMLAQLEQRERFVVEK